MQVQTAHVALLAPVPLIHLTNGLDVCKYMGKVAFGSDAWTVFDDLDNKRDNLPVDVYIYPSIAKEPPHFEVRWHALYIGTVEGVSGAHPAGRIYRPKSTFNYSNGREEHWAIYWEVKDLSELPKPIPIGDLQGYDKRICYKRNFIPKGPVLIEHPKTVS